MGMLYVSSIIGLALCAPKGVDDDSRTSTTQVPISKRINKLNNDGSYAFGLEAGGSISKVKETIKLINPEEDFSTDDNENGIPDALENAPVARVSTSPIQMAEPLLPKKEIDPTFAAAPQTAVKTSQLEPFAFIQRAPQGFPFSFVTPAPNPKLESFNEAQSFPRHAPQLVIGQFQSHSFRPQSFQFNPQFTSFN
ncbi:uncharacterized protein LOC136035844 isoform X2 [Artemia franciscana]|uniref:uncharacterized protein LOC136035844 isoform X2 n=1 Tax=Artemia franciscana TaxID=6661 RepID=UPI0032DB967B